MSRREGYVPAVRVTNEKSLGITQRCTPLNLAWTGDIRKRYTDFLVYEIRKDGTVVHLDDFEVNEEAEKTARKFRQNGQGEDRGAAPSEGTRITTKVEDLSGNMPRNPPPEPTVKPVSEDDKKALASLLNEATAEKLIDLDSKVQAKKQVPQEERSIIFDTIQDRSQRAAVHQEIRRIFESRLETVTDGNGIITAMPTKNTRGKNGRNQGRREGNRGDRDAGRSFANLGGEYLHFTLYKENKDTMDALNTISRLLKIKTTSFGFAGTKDRRAATVQRVSVFRQRKENMIWLNSRLPNIKVGDFNYGKAPLQLGQHGGNEFVITLKNCEPLGSCAADGSVEQRLKVIQSSVETGLAWLKQHGYLNYYGLQRFGTHNIGTHSLGMKILKGDYEGAIDDILNVDEKYMEDVLENKVPEGQGPAADNNRDDFSRAKAITAWKVTKNAAKAFELLPRRFSAEAALIRHLSKAPKDFMGAILSITRGMRMMYIHAYQSYVWNFVASRRWAKYGDKVIEGDLVPQELKNKVTPVERKPDTFDITDAQSVDEGDGEELFYAQVHPLTAEDVASGKYTIFDVVLPTPGFDVSYPLNDIGDYYAEFMGLEENGGLDPFDMRRRNKEFSLSGNYRHLIGQFITEPEYSIRLYSDDTCQLYPTDLDICNHNKKLAAEKLALERRREVSSTPPAEVAATAARWAHFAQNPDQYDKVMDENRRRKAEESPPRDGVTITKETWVQTGFDGSDKRVKLARRVDTVETKAEQPSPIVANDKKEAPLETAPNGSSGLESSNKPNEEKASEVMKDIGSSVNDEAKETEVPSAEPRYKSVSEGYYEHLAKAAATSSLPNLHHQFVVPELNVAMTNPEAPSPDDVVMSNPTGAETSDPLNWYGGKMPDMSSAAMIKTEEEAGKTEETPADTKIGKITMPKFCKPSDNPIQSMNDFSHELIDNPTAKKIAVILKFQLKTSNYATVVLRELMGNGEEESRPSSSGGPSHRSA